jgi:PDZ domain-containing protein
VKGSSLALFSGNRNVPDNNNRRDNMIAGDTFDSGDIRNKNADLIYPVTSPQRRRTNIGWITLLVALSLGIVLAFIPAPYVIERPGPVYNTLGSSEHNGEELPLISINGAPTYPTQGALDLLTVSVMGNREQRPTWLDIAFSWFDPSAAVLPIDAVFPPGVTQSDRNDRNQVLMVNSQKDAVAAALTQLGFNVPAHLNVVSIIPDSPAAGILEPGDQLVALNGTLVTDLDQFRGNLAAAGAGKPATVTINRGGVLHDVFITPVEKNGSVIIAIGVGVDYDFPFEVTIQLDSVGGPSAGMMFALGIIDMLTPGELNGGQKIAGTGTISATGQIGAIGGIRQKMYAARDAGVSWFIAPISNCDEVAGHIPTGLNVFAVSVLDDALAVLNSISKGGDTSSLPTCPTG